MNMSDSVSILMLCSILTSLIVEAIKKMFIVDRCNILVAAVSVVVGTFISIAYIIISSIAFDITTILYIISIVVLSWLCSMLGYDKVVQTLSQMGK